MAYPFSTPFPLEDQTIQFEGVDIATLADVFAEVDFDHEGDFKVDRICVRSGGKYGPSKSVDGPLERLILDLVATEPIQKLIAEQVQEELIEQGDYRGWLDPRRGYRHSEALTGLELR